MVTVGFVDVDVAAAAAVVAVVVAAAFDSMLLFMFQMSLMLLRESKVKPEKMKQEFKRLSRPSFGSKSLPSDETKKKNSKKIFRYRLIFFFLKNLDGKKFEADLTI